MKQSFRFYTQYFLQILEVYVIFAAFIIIGTRLSGSTDNIFGSYAQMFLLFMLILPPVFAMTSGVYLDAALSMGALRRGCFWAVEAALAVSTAALPLLHVPMALLLQSMPGERWTVRPLSPTAYFIFYLLALTFTQLSLLVSHLSGSKVAFVVVSILLVVGAGLGGAFTILVMNADKMSKLPKYFMPLSLTTPLWGITAAVCAALILVLGFFSRRMYGKAVVRL